MNSKQYEDFPDERLVKLLNRSDEFAFDEITRRYYPLLYSFAARRLKDKELTRDLVSDLFTELWEKRSILMLTEVLEVYLVKTFKVLVFEHYKHRLVEDKYVERFAEFMEDRKNNSPHLIRHNNINGLIEMEIAALPPTMREEFEERREKFKAK